MSFFRDLRVAFHSLMRTHGLATVILTLALGIGAKTKMDLCSDDVAPRITNQQSLHFHTGCRLPFLMLRFGVP